MSTGINFEMLKTSTCLKHFDLYSKKVKDLKKVLDIAEKYKIESVDLRNIIEKEIGIAEEYYQEYFNELRTRVFDDKEMKNHFVVLIAKNDFELALAIDKELEVKDD